MSSMRLSFRLRRRILLAIPIAIGCVSPAKNPRLTSEPFGSVIGVVRDSASGEPLEGAIVRIGGVEAVKPDQSDGSGKFRLSRVPSGQHIIIARRIGYVPKRFSLAIEAGRNRSVSVVMSRAGGCDIGCDESEIVTVNGPRKREPVGASSACLPQDSGGTHALDRYRWEDTTDDAGQVKWRTSLGLTRVAVNQISLVNDESICQRALQAFHTEFRDQEEIRNINAVYVIRYGRDRFVIGN